MKKNKKPSGFAEKPSGFAEKPSGFAGLLIFKKIFFWKIKY